ncbi:MAG: hypothetical protein IPL78_06385 [Chloroflexi bacterium]|nr:hypothetical protein [Chloroflexota bacterium]
MTVASVYNPFTEETADTVDLRTTSARLLVFPGQSAAAFRAFNWVKGHHRTPRLEGKPWPKCGDQPVATTSPGCSRPCTIRGITPSSLPPQSLPARFVGRSPAHAVAALITPTHPHPAQPVLLDGVTQWGWWEIHPARGETIGVWKTACTLPAGIPIRMSYASQPLQMAPTVSKGRQDLVWDYVVTNVVPALGGFAPEQTANDWRYLAPHLCPVAECGVEQFFLPDVPSDAISLPQMLFGYVPAQTSVIYDQANVTANANQPPGTRLHPGAESAQHGDERQRHGQFPDHLHHQLQRCFHHHRLAPDGQA